jgi:hypothetical protein
LGSKPATGLFALSSVPLTLGSTTLEKTNAQTRDEEMLYLDFISDVTRDIVTHGVYSDRFVDLT